MQLKFVYILLNFLTFLSLEAVSQTDSCVATSSYGILFKFEKESIDSCPGFCDHPDIRCENPNFTISEFDIAFESSGQRQQVHSIYGGSFDVDIRDKIMKMKKGDKISFICIKAKNLRNGKFYLLKPRTITL